MKLIAVGLGEIGRSAVTRGGVVDGVQVVAAVDPALAGQQLEGLTVLRSIDDCHGVAADVALVSTGSDLATLAPLFVRLLEMRLHVVSTCEVLAFPWLSFPDLAHSLDLTAQRCGRALVACGVNPGFAMDVLPSVIAQASSSIDRIQVVRKVDLSRRRPQLRAKLGVGMAAVEWTQLAKRGGLGHRGLLESAHLCADALGWKLEEAAFSRSPICEGATVIGVAERVDARTPHGQELELSLCFQVDGDDVDEVTVQGVPPIRVRCDGGLPGDTVTVARMLHVCRLAPRLRPGLRLPTEVPIAATDGNGQADE
ncbi:MAG: hypothetical protein JF887_02635 [Candidatus Dormibacteraeota bacterium]|uniref:2,4-diaminopentanoate dehydrogenase C-terminal domain-containing protein n=1 Tax=Candidatus Amunia macphersoniae TaxID=3127014 RepID=A0A934NFN0_9BACT|nr:hypothetical protein [Candidatus Dormibacteraeota bacterium]